ncbi:MAG: MraY family glycosyltransferase [Candidatus Aenigmatarchaeota archaeon]
MITVAWLRLPIHIASLILFTFSFLVTFFVTPKLIKYLKQAGITGKDMNKKDKPKVAEMGGLAIIVGFCASLLPSIGVTRGETLVHLLGILSVTLIVTIIGILDDILGWKRGIRQWQHALLPIFASFPLIALRAGEHTMNLPFMGPTNFGILYPLILIPLGITGASNAVNMLGGMNGLRMSLCGIISFSLGLVGLHTGDVLVSSISFSLTGAILAFLYFNWYPAEVFPGDTGTLGVGAIIASIVIIGNIEKTGVLLFTLFFVELILKARSKFQAENWGQIQEDGTLKPRYKKSYSLTQATMKLGQNFGGFTEKQVATSIIILQALIAVFTLIII